MGVFSILLEQQFIVDASTCYQKTFASIGWVVGVSAGLNGHYFSGCCHMLKWESSIKMKVLKCIFDAEYGKL